MQEGRKESRMRSKNWPLDRDIEWMEGLSNGGGGCRCEKVDGWCCGREAGSTSPTVRQPARAQVPLSCSAP